MTEAPRSRVRLPACLLLASALLGCAVDVAEPTPVSPSSPEAPPASAPKAATPRTNEGSGKPQGSDAPIGPAMGEVIHGSFGEAIDVDLLPPAPVDTPLGRNRRRVDLDQLDALIRAATGGIGWEIGGKNQFVDLALTLGKPDYLDQTNEDLEPTALFQKFLSDAARAVCRDTRIRDEKLAAAQRVLMMASGPTDTMATSPAAIDLNLRALLLRYHGRSVALDAPELEHWRWLYETAELKLTSPAAAWQVVCVGLITHPDFYTY